MIIISSFDVPQIEKVQLLLIFNREDYNNKFYSSRLFFFTRRVVFLFFSLVISGEIREMNRRGGEEGPDTRCTVPHVCRVSSSCYLTGGDRSSYAVCMCRPVMPRAKRWREIDRGGKIARFRVFWLFHPGVSCVQRASCDSCSDAARSFHPRANHANPSRLIVHAPLFQLRFAFSSPFQPPPRTSKRCDSRSDLDQIAISTISTQNRKSYAI